MNKIRLIQPAIAIPRYRMLRMPVVAAEFARYAEVQINDENVEKLDFSQVDLVGITCQSYNANRAFYISGKFRQLGIKTMLGGVFATVMTDMALEHFDSVVVGEVEGLGEEIVNDLSRGALKKVYKNPVPPDLTVTSKPRFDLSRNDKYYQFNFPIETSRGCPHNCSFCFSSYHYPTYRKRSLQDIERDLGQWDNGVVELIDLHCLADKEFMFQVCGVLKNMNVLSWMGEATIMSLKDEKTVKKLADSNCRMMFVGLESVSAKVLSGINKKFNDVNEYKRIIRMCQDHGIYIHAGFVWGLDGQDETTYDETLKFCNDAKIYLAGSNILTYFPGTAIYRENEEKGKIITTDLRDYDSARITALTDGFDAKILLKGVKRFVRKFFSVGSIIRRSFQSTNKNIMLLYDFIGFNYGYRIYYKNWIKKVEQGLKRMIASQEKGESLHRENPKVLDEKNSLPHLHKNVPSTYNILEWNWRYWNFWFHKYINPKGKPGLLFILFSLAGYLAAGLTFFGYLELPLDRFNIPVGLSGIAGTVIIYSGLWLFTGMMAYTVSKLVKGPFFLSIIALLLELPLFYLPFSLEPSLLSLVLAFANALFFLKNIDYFLSAQRSKSSYYRYFVFLAYYPSLDFGSAFQVDFKTGTFGIAFKLFFIGALQVLLGCAVYLLAIFCMVYFIEANEPTSYIFWVIILLKALYVYFAFAGTMNLVTASWKVWGYKLQEHFKSPVLAVSIRDFWRRFNADYYRWSLRNIYFPLVHRFSRKGKVNKFALVNAVMIPFLVSALACIYVLSTILIAPGIDNVEGLNRFIEYIAAIIIFFGIHGSLAAFGNMIKSMFSKRRRTPLLIRAVRNLFTIILVCASSAVFFFVTDRVIKIIWQ